ncbi:MAG: methyltransferase domain-containing protein [Caldimonas sp.]
MARTVAAETLDGLSEDDPAARRSRADLRRIHRFMGTRSIVARALREMLAERPAGKPLRVLELGAGDGSLMLGVAGALGASVSRVELTLLDRQRLLAPSTVDAYAALGWTAKPAVIDVHEWVAARSDPFSRGSGGARRRWDLIVANLFLHHFEGAPLSALLASIAARTDRFFACEPSRARVALWGSRLVGVIGANAVTREDAVLSVHAGFRDHELTALWADTAEGWDLREHSAGLFSHCLRAQRTRAPRNQS